MLFLAAGSLAIIAAACGSDATPVPTSTAAPVAAPSPTPAPIPAPSPTPTPGTQKTRRADGDLDPSADTPYSVTEKPFVTRAEFEGWKTNFMRRTIRLDELARNVPRDFIKSIDEPAFTPVAEAGDRLEDREPVIVVEVGGDARAYPLNILIQNEIVNDTIGGTPVAVTYCPLCNSSIAFERVVNGTTRKFHTSGMLRRSDLVMYDDSTETLWQQLTGEGVVGDEAGIILEPVAAQAVSWKTFKDRFPDGVVLDQPNIPGIDYSTSAYAGYDDNLDEKPFLFNDLPDRRIPPISRVSAFDLGSGPVAYAFNFLRDNPVINDTLGDIPIVVFFDDKTESAFESKTSDSGVNVVGSTTAFFRDTGDIVLTFSVDESGEIRDDETGSTWDRFGLAVAGQLEGQELAPVIHGDHFWFAWAAFKPDTTLVAEASDLTGR